MAIDPLFSADWREGVRAFLAPFDCKPRCEEESRGDWRFYHVETPGQTRPLVDDTRGVFRLGKDVFYYLDRVAGQAGRSAFVWATKERLAPLEFWGVALMLDTSSVASFSKFWLDYRISPTAEVFDTREWPRIDSYVVPYHHPQSAPTELPIIEESIERCWRLNVKENAQWPGAEFLFETPAHFCWWQWSCAG